MQADRTFRHHKLDKRREDRVSRKMAAKAGKVVVEMKRQLAALVCLQDSHLASGAGDDLFS
jgi:hypothetical protein